MDNRIVNFIKRHHLLTLATVKNNEPYCSNAFYVFDEKKKTLIFSSDIKTKHAQQFIENPKVAASIALETTVIERIQGVQLLGEIKDLTQERLQKAKKLYLETFPYARLMKLCLWEFHLTFVKMTCNHLGFGKKLIWEK